MIKKTLLWLLSIVAGAILLGWFFWPANWSVRGPVFDFITGRQAATPSDAMLQARLKLPAGFRIGIFADNVPHARMMAVTKTGDIAVSSMRDGNVILLHRDVNADGKSDGRTILFSGLNVPHGIAFHDGYIYIAETGRIVRAPYNDAARSVGALETVFDGLPPGGNHRTRTIGFGPDGWLYVTVGSSCNVCVEDHPYRAAMLRMRPNGKDAIVYAHGLRNTVGFDWQPGTRRLYGTDNGRDLLGDNIPNCEINYIEEGQFYGWPYTYDDKVVDPDVGAGHSKEIARARVMEHGLGAHVAPLGIRFIAPSLSVPGLENSALVALHGSWNRSTLSGYKVVALHFAADDTITEEDFLTGFEKDGDVIGRPVDIVTGSDGSIYISDDYAGVVYRVGWDTIPVSSDQVIAPEDKTDGDPVDAALEVPSAALLAQGAALFEQNNCAQCHEPLATTGKPSVEIFKGLKGRYGVEEVMDILDIPPGPMPRPEISDAERKALAVYLLSRSN
ncbi:DUF7133 domain-containing protein [Kordiimonas pumila]|uniref:PQQ-dependent sugar dehydrogenase n=1 Tax=Kordiimonas pumila TaxID=2161677 RepID=A0ABV7D6L8_9PROT|nr:PQQ-dependent sugar dehydrogenase [Kordiimonas pumila]